MVALQSLALKPTESITLPPFGPIATFVNVPEAPVNPTANELLFHPVPTDDPDPLYEPPVTMGDAVPPLEA